MGIRIALQGDGGSGKSTLARYMESEYGWYVMRYSDSLKQSLCDALNYFRQIGEPHIMVGDIHTNKSKYRRVLQELGTAVGFDEGVGVQAQIDEWKLYRDSAKQPVIFDNVRFPSQFELLKKHGFILVELFVDFEERKRRALLAGVNPADMAHTAENSHPLADIYLNANGSVEETAAILLAMNGQRASRKKAA